MKLNKSLLIPAAFIFLPGALPAAEPADLLAGFDQVHLSIEAPGNRCIQLGVYLAVTDQQKARGLMFVRKLDTLEGMLFRYDQEARITMWMKNTYIPLDMIFADTSGTITGIANNTRPLSTDRITSPDGTAWVLEVNAGFSGKRQIKPGDKLRLEPCPDNRPEPATGS